MWNIIITISTVGFGDVYAKSTCGRIIIIGIAFTGIFITALMVTSLINSRAFDPAEQKAYIMENRLKAKDSLLKCAANVFTSTYRLSKLKKEHPDDIMRLHMLQKDYNEKR